MSCCKGEMGHKRIDISHMSHADNMGGHKRIHFLYMSHKGKWRGQPALVQLVPDTINFVSFRRRRRKRSKPIRQSVDW